MAETEKPEKGTYDFLIEDLIQKVDKETSLFGVRDFLIEFGSFILDIVGILVVIFAIFYSSSFSFSDRVIIGFAGLSLILSLGQLISANIKETEVRAKYRNAAGKINPSIEDKPLLKALIKMKSENNEFTLAEIYNLHPEMFTKEKLLEKLYEASK